MSGYKQDITKLDSPWRREVLPPLAVLKTLGLAPVDDLADVGCGIGYFAIPATEIVDPSRKVYGVDPSREMLDELARRMTGKADGRIELVQSDPEDFRIPSESVDFILMANVFHEVDAKEGFLREARRILRPGGRVGLVEWRAAEAPFGPPLDHRISEDETDRWFVGAGFLPGRSVNLGEIFYGRIYMQP